MEMTSAGVSLLSTGQRISPVWSRMMLSKGQNTPSRMCSFTSSTSRFRPMSMRWDITLTPSSFQLPFSTLRVRNS